MAEISKLIAISAWKLFYLLHPEVTKVRRRLQCHITKSHYLSTMVTVIVVTATFVGVLSMYVCVVVLIKSNRLAHGQLERSLL